jgi:hypothetical protein
LYLMGPDTLYVTHPIKRILYRCDHLTETGRLALAPF